MKRFFITAFLLFFAQRFAGGEKCTATLGVKGMHCSSCVSMIKHTLRKIGGVDQVGISLQSGTVTLECSDTSARSQAARAIEHMGYKVSLYDSLNTTSTK